MISIEAKCLLSPTTKISPQSEVKGNHVVFERKSSLPA
jgi:hypothetical protein